MSDMPPMHLEAELTRRMRECAEDGLRSGQYISEDHAYYEMSRLFNKLVVGAAIRVDPARNVHVEKWPTGTMIDLSEMKVGAYRSEARP